MLYWALLLNYLCFLEQCCLIVRKELCMMRACMILKRKRMRWVCFRGIFYVDSNLVVFNLFIFSLLCYGLESFICVSLLPGLFWFCGRNVVPYGSSEARGNASYRIEWKIIYASNMVKVGGKRLTVPPLLKKKITF